MCVGVGGGNTAHSVCVWGGGRGGGQILIFPSESNKLFFIPTGVTKAKVCISLSVLLSLSVGCYI